MWSYISNQVSNVLVEKESRGIQTESSDQDRVIRTYKYDMAQLQSKFKALEISHKKSIQINDELIQELNSYKETIDEQRILELSKRNFISISMTEEKQSFETDTKFLPDLKKSRNILFPMSERTEKYKECLMEEYFDYCSNPQRWQKEIFQKHENYLASLSNKGLLLSYISTAVLLDNTDFILENLLEKILKHKRLEISLGYTHHIPSLVNDINLANIELRREIQSKTIELDKAKKEILDLKNELKFLSSI